MGKLSLGNMPDEIEFLKPGIFTFKCKTAEIVTSPKGNKGLQLSHTEVNGKGNLNFDNYYIVNGDGDIINFPLTKLKKLIIATGLDKAMGNQEFEPEELLTFLKKTLPGKTFRAEVQWKDDEEKYVEIKGSNYYPVEENDANENALAEATADVADDDGFTD